MSIYEGLFIRKARKLAGYTQEQLSEKIGLSLAPINQVENGWESISLNRLRTICEAIGLEVVIKQKDAENTANN
jgi:transcriptional regulator with XRE-family HTH domain